MQSVNPRDYMGPLVYLFMGDDGPLYIGKGSNVTRPFSVGHQKAKVRDGCNEVILLFCKTQKEADQLERRLIHEHQPPHNRHGVITRRDTSPPGSVQIFRRDPAEVQGDFTDPSTGEWITFKR